MRMDRSVLLHSSELERLLPGLNALAVAQFTARVRNDEGRGSGLTASRLAALGISAGDCRDLIDLGFLEANGRLCASSLVHLTDAGLAQLQDAIPLGAIRPVFDIRSRKLTVVGKVIRTLAVQARNQSTFLTTLEAAGWPPRIEKPLNGRASGDGAHRIAVTAYYLTSGQQLIDFHADDGNATWNWRQRSYIEL